MSIPTTSRSQGLKVAFTMAALLSTPVWADQASLLAAPEQRRPHSAFQLEIQPPSPDGSVYGIRAEGTPSEKIPLTFGVMRRVGSWRRNLGMQARFSGTDVGAARLHFAVGVEARYALATFADGALSPFIGVTGGVEQFEVRSKLDGNGSRYSPDFFVEPAVGLTYRPGAGHFGLIGRVGPGFTSSGTPDHSFDGGTLSLRSVYPTASLGLIFAL
ncbi:hypothetical protein [Hyalangium versicolor]|uniref:hypothetical protein n=1 Tax=Hyalangium versicolor TaxID=2861190 RepID=UPI001CCE51FF|nr:hypothetical protein [Hyalangium versicolor]